MKTIKTIIVDDEPLALNLLRAYLNKYTNIEVVAECQNGRQAIDKTNELQPDLMFLDIQMPGLSGFDVIQNLQADTMPLVVFITAYDQYALKAFDVYAVDYLLKPLDLDHLDRAIKRCRNRLASTGSANNKPEIIEALRNIGVENVTSSFRGAKTANIDDNENALSSQKLPKIVVKDRDIINLIDQQNIDWVDAAGDYMCIHVAGETYIMRSTLKALLSQLEPSLFQRVHRSTIVNLSRIEKIIPCAKGEYLLVLGNNERIKVSRNFKAAIKELISTHENSRLETYLR
ncbi:MAG: two-component system LytT family response regulator [Arenicella sp.]